MKNTIINEECLESNEQEEISNDNKDEMVIETVTIDNVFSDITVSELEPIEIIKTAKLLLSRKYSKTDIAKYLGITRKTLYKYLSMTKEDLNKSRKPRAMKAEFEQYKSHIIAFLTETPELSNSQVYGLLLDFFQEFYGESDYVLTVSKNTVANYCNVIRKEYAIEKPVIKPQQRDYVMQTHDVIGKYMQVDFGEYKMNVNGVTTIKVYFIVFTLCFSKMTYVDFLNRPFKAKDVVISHLRSIKYFGGVTEQIIYDQDKTMLSKENFGDYLYTEEFKYFVNGYEIKPLFCHAYDPEAKGLVENSVKFVKQHFLNGRKYKGLDVLRNEALKWCAHVAKRKHGTTLKKPEYLFQIEKEQLRQVLITDEISYDILTRSVSKYNSISLEGNRYSVPIGTYGYDTRYVRVEFETRLDVNYIRIYKADTTKFLCEHKRYPSGSGRVVSIPEHRRDSSRAQAIEKAIERFVLIFSNKQIAIDYAEAVIIEYSSRRREKEQLDILTKVAAMYIQEKRDCILEFCALNKLYGLDNFNKVANELSLGYHLNELDNQTTENHNEDSENTITNNLDKYTKILSGGNKKDGNSK